MGVLMSVFNKEELFLWFKEYQPQMVLNEITPQTERPGTVYLSPRIEAKGFYSIMSNNRRYGYELSIVISTNPDEFFIPTVFCIDKKLYPSLHRHILSDRQACLGTILDIVADTGFDLNFNTFAKIVLDPFIAWQLYYDTFGEPPPWGERKHGVVGIFQAIEDRLSAKWNITLDQVHQLILEKPYSKKKPCFCGSKKQFRYCHGRPINKIRKTIDKAEIFFRSNRLDKNEKINEMLSRVALKIIFDIS